MYINNPNMIPLRILCMQYIIIDCKRRTSPLQLQRVLGVEWAQQFDQGMLLWAAIGCLLPSSIRITQLLIKSIHTCSFECEADALELMSI